ncbi:hypothetical protein T492DRAFT_864698, partial [Pavlovales sp. CCMP2436]
LNEIWPTGGWSTLEYSSSPGPSRTHGQVAHHWLRQHLFADVLAACGVGGVCFAREAHNVTVELGAHRLDLCVDTAAAASAARAKADRNTDAGADAEPREGAPCSASVALALPAGPALLWFTQPPQLLAGLVPAERFLSLAVRAASPPAVKRAGPSLSAHAELLVPPARLARLPRARILAKVGKPGACEGEAYGEAGLRPRWCTPVSLLSSCTALFVTLTARVGGHFDRNCMPLLAGEAVRVHFASDARPDVGALRASLRVEDLSAHQSGTDG